MKVLGYIFGSLVIILLITLAVLGTLLPETYVYLGRQVPEKYKTEIKNLGLLDSDEEIKYFYTNGLFDIKDGMSFVTDRKLVVYSQEWDEPETVIGFDEISQLHIDYNESFLEDSYITLETVDGLEIEFPVSSEKKRDKAFFDYLLQKSEIQPNSVDSDALDNNELELIVDTIQ